jgi:hypothetical protein
MQVSKKADQECAETSVVLTNCEVFVKPLSNLGMWYHARGLPSQAICAVGLTVCIVLASCSTRPATDNRSFALTTAPAQIRTETRTPEPTDTPELSLTRTPRSNLPAQTPTPFPMTVSSVVPDDETIAALISVTCFSHGVADVQVTVGQTGGGQKGAIVTLKTDTDDLEEVASIVEAVLRAVHQVNTGDIQADLDFASIVIGDAAGMTAMTVTVPMAELEAWMAGEITNKEFIDTWVIKDF